MRDDEFEPQLGRMRGRGKEQRYLSRVVKAAKRAGMKTGRRGRFDGSRIGRGASVARVLRSRDRLGAFRSRRVIVKIRPVGLGGKGMGGAKAHYDGIVAFSQTDFTEDLKKITVPVLVMHGDDDQIVPYADSAPLSAKLLKNGTLKTYKGFPHGMPTTEAETINADLLAFIKS